MSVAQYRKTVYTVMWVEVILLAYYQPYCLTINIILSLGSPTVSDAIWAYSATIVRVNSSLNPVIYCRKITGVRQEVKNMTRQLLCL